MITIETLCHRIQGLRGEEVELWIGRAWLRAEGGPGHYRLSEIDVARARLIHELRQGLALDEEALPVVLSLLDQLYSARRQMRRLRAALDAADAETREHILAALRMTEAGAEGAGPG